jgi:RNA polymerase-binding transcription factor DksA
MELNEKLTKLLAGQNATLVTMKLPWEEKPGEKPQEKLRRFLDVVSRAQKRLGTEAWGLCIDCGAEVPEAVLDEVPWTERCRPCQTKWDA